MRFYEGARPTMFIQSGRPKMDKNNKRTWRLNMAITVKAAEMPTCGSEIQDAYEAVDTREKKCTRYEINGDIPDMIIRFFALDRATSPCLTLRAVKLENLAMTRDPEAGNIDLWVSFEHEMTDALHKWVKEYFGARLWAEFESAQLPLIAPKKTKAEQTTMRIGMKNAEGKMEYGPAITLKDLNKIRKKIRKP